MTDLHEIADFTRYPEVHRFVRDHVSMQLGDVRDMLRLPLPRLGLTHGCNFAATSILCGLISGISVSIYQPQNPTRTTKNGSKEWVGFGEAFRGLLIDFYPWAPRQTQQQRASFATDIYDLFRNPLAHALGVRQKPGPPLAIARVGPRTRPQLRSLENLLRRPPWLPATLGKDGKVRRLVVEGFYRDFFDMMQRLTRDVQQMADAESRFAHGKIIWLTGKP